MQLEEIPIYSTHKHRLLQVVGSCYEQFGSLSVISFTATTLFFCQPVGEPSQLPSFFVNALCSELISRVLPQELTLLFHNTVVIILLLKMWHFLLLIQTLGGFGVDLCLVWDRRHSTKSQKLAGKVQQTKGLVLCWPTCLMIRPPLRRRRRTNSREWFSVFWNFCLLLPEPPRPPWCSVLPSPAKLPRPIRFHCPTSWCTSNCTYNITLFKKNNTRKLFGLICNNK